MPDAFKAFFDDLEKKNVKDAGGDPDRLWGARTAQSFVRERIDRFEMGLDRGEKDYHLTAAVSPLTLPPPGKFSRPGLPDGCFGRVDLACPPAQAFPFIDARAVDQLTAIDGANGRTKETPEKRRKYADCYRAAGTQFLTCDAVTVGVAGAGEAGDVPVVYVVSQYAKPPDFAAGLKPLVGQLTDADADEPPAEGTRLHARILRRRRRGDVARVRLDKGGKPAGYLDVVQRGATVLMTFSPDPGHHVEALLSAPAQGEMKSAIACRVEAGPLADFAIKKGWVPAARRGELAGILTGQTVELTVDGRGDAIVFDATVARSLVRDLARFFGGPL